MALLARSICRFNSRIAVSTRISNRISAPKVSNISNVAKSFLRGSASVAVESSQLSARSQKIVGTWLIGCSGMCFGAVILGGVTRLTESGLSMTDWKLFKDMKPPRSQEEWELEFNRYKEFPEYKYMNAHKEMTVSDFKFIYYMEWGHRMWGRTTGLVFLFPAIYFLRKGWISKPLKPRLAIFAGLLGFQGFLGWYMVKSGLTDKPGPSDVPRVSQYRLASHLGSAFLLYTLFLWQGLNHLMKPIKLPEVSSIARLRGMAHGVMTAVFVTALSATTSNVDNIKPIGEFIPNTQQQVEVTNFIAAIILSNHGYLLEVVKCKPGL